MNTRTSARSLRSVLASVALTAASASAWCGSPLNFNNATVDYVFAGDSRACVFFRLVGVGEADPAVPGSAWFALPKTHPLFRETYSLLLSAKLASHKVNVSTTGAIDPCGHAQVLAIALPGQ